VGGGFTNDTWQPMTGANNWSNVTKFTNTTVGCKISWIVYANNSANSWNASSTFEYNTTTIPNALLASFGTNPVNYYNDSDGSVVFDMKCSDESSVSYLQLWTNTTGTWQVNKTNSSPYNNSWWNVTVTGIPEGSNYKWAVWCNDSNGNTNITNANRTLNVDKTNPIASQGTNPIEGYSSFIPIVVFDMRCSDNIAPSYIQLWGNWSGTWQAEYTDSDYNNNTWLNISKTIPVGNNHKWAVWCNDSAGRTNITTNRSFSILFTSDNWPIVTLYSPVDYFNSSKNYIDTFNCSAYDDRNVTNISLYGNWSTGWHANQTNSSPYNNTKTIFNVTGIPNGYYAWNCRACDNASQCLFSVLNRTITVDTIAPIASFGTNPIDNYNDTDGSVTFDMRCSDNIAQSYLQLWGNWSGTWQVNQTNSSPYNNSWWNVTVTGIPEGRNFKWAVYCNDSLGWTNQTTNRTLNVDTIAPIASFGTNPIDNYNDTDGSVTFDMKCSDNIAPSYLQLYGNWSGVWQANQTNSSPYNNTWWNVTVTGIPLGNNYKWAVWCNDTSGNSNITQNRTFNVLAQINMSYVNPTPGNNTRRIANSETINVSVNGTNSISSCLLSWNSGAGYVNESMTIEGSGTNVFCSKTKSTVDGTTYLYKIYANETLGMVNETLAQTFRENAKPPVLVLNNPNDGNHTTNRTPQFSWTMTTDDDGDTLTTQLNITPNCASVDCDSLDSKLKNVTNNGTSYVLLPSEKFKNLYEAGDYQDNYTWKVITYDGYEWSSSYSSARTIFIDSRVVLTLVNDTTNFGSMILNENNETTDNNPNPLLLQNDGNCFVDVNLSSSDLLWNSISGPSNYYLYKMDRYAGWNSFNFTESQTTWAQVPDSNITSISALNYTSGNNRTEIDMNVTVPGDELAGSKSSLLSFTGYYIHDP